MNRRGFLGALSGAAAFLGLSKAAPETVSVASGAVNCDVVPISTATNTIPQYGFESEGDFRKAQMAIAGCEWKVPNKLLADSILKFEWMEH